MAKFCKEDLPKIFLGFAICQKSFLRNQTDYAIFKGFSPLGFLTWTFTCFSSNNVRKIPYLPQIKTFFLVKMLGCLLGKYFLLRCIKTYHELEKKFPIFFRERNTIVNYLSLFCVSAFKKGKVEGY